MKIVTLRRCAYCVSSVLSFEKPNHKAQKAITKDTKGSCAILAPELSLGLDSGRAVVAGRVLSRQLLLNFAVDVISRAFCRYPNCILDGIGI
jgi:hypothetical protein